MLSESIIKTDFISTTGKWGFDKLKKEQISILESSRGTLSAKRFDVNELIDDVINRRMNISQSGNGVTFIFKVLKKLRFADMKKLGNAKVYNRPMWGIIFGEKDSVVTRIKYDFTEKTRDDIYQKLHKEFESENIKIEI